MGTCRALRRHEAPACLISPAGASVFQKQSSDCPVLWPTPPLWNPHCACSWVPQVSRVLAEGLA